MENTSFNVIMIIIMCRMIREVHEQMENRRTEEQKRKFCRCQRKRKSPRHDDWRFVLDPHEQRESDQRRYKSEHLRVYIYFSFFFTPRIVYSDYNARHFCFQLDNKKKKLEESVKKSYTEYYTYCVRTARAKWVAIRIFITQPTRRFDISVLLI